MLKVIFHHRILLWNEFRVCLLLPIILFDVFVLALFGTDVLVELPGVFITRSDLYEFPVNFGVFSNIEIFDVNEMGRVFFKDFLPLQKTTLWEAGIHLFWLVDFDCVILEVIEDDKFSNSGSFKRCFDTGLLKETLEGDYLFIHLHIIRLKLLSDLTRNMWNIRRLIGCLIFRVQSLLMTWLLDLLLSW